MIFFSWALIYFTALTAPSIVRIGAPANLAYAKAADVIANTSGVYVFVEVVPNGFNFTTTGGWVLLVDTAQQGVLNPLNGTYLYAKLGLTPKYMELTNIGVKGVVDGYLDGAPAEIAFFGIVPVHVENSVVISKVYYRDCVLTVTFNSSTLVPVVLSSIVNMSLYTYYTHEYLFNTINVPFNVTIYIQPGDHVVNMTIPLRPIYEDEKKVLVYSCSVAPGVLYTLYLPINITYYYPTANITKSIVMFKVFAGGGP